MTDNELIAKTINKGNIDLAQYPAAKVQQMTKKLESSKATAKHIKKHTSSMQGATQINVLQHNHTAYHLRRKRPVKKPNPSKGTKLQQPQQHKQVNKHQPLPYDKNPNQCTKCDDSPYTHKDLIAWLRNINVNIVPKSDTSQRCALPKMHTHSHSNIIEVSQSRHI